MLNINKEDLTIVNMAIAICGYPKVCGAWERVINEIERASKKADEARETNKQSDAICPKSAVTRISGKIICIEDGEDCTGIIGACGDGK
jgi:predicted transcriptional regulator